MELKEHTLIRAEIKNISLQKRIMDNLRRRNRDYSAIFNKASEFTYRIGLRAGEPVVEYVSEDFSEFTGISPETVNKEGGLEKLVHAEDIGKVKQHYRSILEGRKATCEYRIKTKSGDYIEIIDYGKPSWDDSMNKVTCCKGAVTVKATVGSV